MQPLQPTIGALRRSHEFDFVLGSFVMNLLALAGRIAPRLFAIRKGTWIALGGGLLLVFGLLIWAGVAALSWLWGQTPALAEAGKRAADVALAQVEQAAPGLKEQAAVWLPDVSKDAAAVNELPVRDVSGPDIGPVARYPGLARDYYSREGRSVEVHYAGRADFQAVLEHYTRGFTAAGYRQEVLNATRAAEQHRYAKGDDLIELKLLAKPHDSVQVILKDTI